MNLVYIRVLIYILNNKRVLLFLSAAKINV